MSKEQKHLLFSLLVFNEFLKQMSQTDNMDQDLH